MAAELVVTLGLLQNLGLEPLVPLRVPIRKIQKYYKRASEGELAEAIEAVEDTLVLVIEAEDVLNNGDGASTLEQFGRAVYRNRLRDALKHLFEVTDVLEERPHNRGRDEALRSCYALTQRAAEYLGQTVQELQASSV